MKRKILIGSIIILSSIFYLKSYAFGPKVNLARLVWDANTETNLSSYYVYWKTLDSTNWVQRVGAWGTSTYNIVTNRIGIDKLTTEYDLNLLSLPRGIYSVALTAVNTSGAESALSTSVLFTNQYPNPPQNLVIKTNINN